MTTVAYIANEFPSRLEPYVIDEIEELRRRGVRVICCSGKRVSPEKLSLKERAFWKETRYFQPLTDMELMRAGRRLVADPPTLGHLARQLVFDRKASIGLRVRSIAHTWMGAALAEDLANSDVQHIHAHHGYFASWMALVAARLLGIGFSFTLHGSDLLRRADLLGAKLQDCRFCVTVSDYNKRYILRKYPRIPQEKIVIHRLGVDRTLGWPTTPPIADSENGKFHLLAVGRLHPIKDFAFLIDACAELTQRNFDFECSIVGEGPERPALEKKIAKFGLGERVGLVGHLPRPDVMARYREADLVVMTSKSEGIPVVLMEAMSMRKLVLAPEITGIPELVEHRRTGFLYTQGSLASFVDTVEWIREHKSLLTGIQRAAVAKVAESFSRQRNLRAFADDFLHRISDLDGGHAHPVLQQVRLSV